MAVDIFLDVEGRSFGGWTRVRVDRHIDNVCIIFGMLATRSWPGLEDQWWIEAGDRVTVRVGDQVICTGWIDEISPNYDATTHRIQISGRSMCADLVDCSYVGPPWQWKNADPAEVIRALCGQFSIPVQFDADLGEPFDFTIQQGEHGWDAIDRICRLRQVLAYEEPDGTLLITRGSEETCDTALVQGGNILAASAQIDDRKRFSHYIIKGQQPGDDDTSPVQAATSLGEADDKSVRRYRPLLIVQRADTDNTAAEDRAKWERQQRWGDSRKATIDVEGLVQPNGKLWPINRLCEVYDAWLGLDRQMAITGMSIDASDAGLRTTLTVQPPEALTPAVPQKPSAKSKPKSSGGGAASGGGTSYWDQVDADRQAGEARRRETKQ